LQTEVNFARKKLLVVLWCSYSHYYPVEKQILYHQIVRKDVHFRNWYATCKIGILL